MVNLDIILTVLTALFGGGNVVAFILYYRQNKKIKEYEVKQTEIDTKGKELDLGEYWQKAVDECEESREYYRGIIRDKDNYIVELNTKISELSKEANHLRLENQSLHYCKCTVFNCLKRQPPTQIFGNFEEEENKD